ncbi:vWA domain-containing protein [Longilinea arvoryzae]|uniref:vWA domain-containing protein n=1 Tax=Longilinea arvoryzae TaxID=360412 RepID=UPI0012602F0E|nr:vWA domain-containing protein [Longilinea arvoryzae]
MTVLPAQVEADEESVCTSSQVVLIIDQSQSMDLRNDPNDLRFYIPMYVADILARNYINARMTANRLDRPMTVQMAVIQFASKATIGLDWTTISPVDYAAWQGQRDQILAQGLLTADDYLSMVPLISNGTNMQAAFDKVAELIDRAAPQVEGCPRRTYLMLTDGNPDSNGDPIREPLLGEYMDNVKSLVDGKLLGDGSALYVTAINDSSDNYWRVTEKYWMGITHESERTELDEPERAAKVSTRAEIGLRMSNIVNFRLDRGVVNAQVGPNVVPPYLERVIFTFFKPDRDNVIELTDPQGRVLTAGPDVVVTGLDEGIQTIELIRPEPGIYQLATTASSGDYYITKDMIFIKTSMQSDMSRLYQFGCFPIEISLVDSENRPIPRYDDPRYALKVEATLKSAASGESMALPLAYDSATGKITGIFTPVYTGDNQLSITAVAMDDYQEKWTVLKPPFADFDLYVDRLVISTGEAENAENSACSPAQYSPINMPVQFIVAGSGVPVNLCVKPEIEVKGKSFESLQVIGPDADGVYTLSGLPQNSGEQSLLITAVGANPTSGQLVDIATASTSVALQPGHQYDLSIHDMGMRTSGLLNWLNRQMTKINGDPEPDVRVIGRQLFFTRPQVTLKASLMEGNTPAQSSDLLPVAQLVPQQGEAVQADGWQYSDGVWNAVFQSVPLGQYDLQLTYPAAPCGAHIQVNQTLRTVRVVAGLGEWIVWLVLGLLALIGLVLLICWLLCRFWNPASGWIGVLDNNNHTVWKFTLEGSSCWNLEKPAVVNCSIVRIKIYGVFHIRGFYRLRIYCLDPNTNREKLVIDVIVNLKELNTRVGGYRIKWVQDLNQLPF